MTVSTGEVTIPAQFPVEMANKMLTARPDAHQTSLFGRDLLLQLDPEDPLLKLFCVIPWRKFDQDFAIHYAKGVGAPSNESPRVSGEPGAIHWFEMGNHNVTPGKQQQYAYVKRFNRTARYEWLSQHHNGSGDIIPNDPVWHWEASPRIRN